VDPKANQNFNHRMVQSCGTPGFSKRFVRYKVREPWQGEKNGIFLGQRDSGDFAQ
jgi:hypothetical protein